jgi:hypothetical protein
MTVQELIKLLHEAAGGDNSYYDKEVVIAVAVSLGCSCGHTEIGYSKIDGVGVVNDRGVMKFEVQHWVV